jgi:starch synthase
MKILLATSEAHPYSKSGGLADMVGALAKFLALNGHQVGLVTPLYRGIRERFPEIQPMDWKLDFPIGFSRVQGGVWTLTPGEGNLTVYFIDQPQYFDRAALYGEGGSDYADNAERFIFFNKAVVNLARYLPWEPQLVHIHDWQSCLIPILMLHQRLHEGWATLPPVCLTIHNLAYQGVFPGNKYGLTNLPNDYFHPGGVEFFGTLNSLKAGIAYSNIITTVSPRYAREITTEQFGCGLDGILRNRQNSLTGILNGVDYDEWKTTGNPILPAPYSVADMDGKAVNKAALQQEMGLPVRADVPLFGTISRLTEQKGVDIQLAALEEMLSADIQFVLLGTGDPQWSNGYRKLMARYPDKCAANIGFDQKLSHRIEAGCDFFLMPSRFEPCGLNQMYSLRYGTIPIVRMTGGLDDSVTDIAESVDQADGIKFQEYSARALAKAIRKALVVFSDPALLAHYRRNGMLKDFSWSRTASAYEAVYRRVVAG